MASRIAARSTTAGTPVKSCISTRAGLKAISFSAEPLFSSPVRRVLDVGLAGAAAVFIAQHVLDDDFQGERQPRDAGQAIPLRRRKRIIGVGLSTDDKCLAGVEAVEILLHHEVPLHSKYRQATPEGTVKQEQQHDAERFIGLHRLRRQTAQFASTKRPLS